MSTQSQFPVLLNVDIVENESAYSIEANITRFQAQNVRVSSWEDSLIIEMQTCYESNQTSFYMGELELETYRRVIPLGFDLSGIDIHTAYRDNKLTIGVSKPTRSKTTIRDKVLTA